MQVVINTCDRCGIRDDNEHVNNWGADIPRGWMYIGGKLLCPDCLKKYGELFDAFVSLGPDAQVVIGGTIPDGFEWSAGELPPVVRSGRDGKFCADVDDDPIEF